MAADAFDATKINTEAQHWIRWRLGDTKIASTGTKRLLASQDTIIAILAIHGLVATDSPVTKSGLVRLAAIDVCRGIIATLSQDSEVTLTEVGAIKKGAAGEFRKVLESLLAETGLSAPRPRFFGSVTYEPSYIDGVDELPDPEA